MEGPSLALKTLRTNRYKTVSISATWHVYGSASLLPTIQCLLVRHSSQGYLIEKKRRRCLTGHKSKQVWAVFAVNPMLILRPEEPDTAYHEPLEGPQGKKDSFSAHPAAGAHPRLLSQFLCVSVLCKFLTFITANSSPCSFLNFCLKKYFTLILTESKDKHTCSIYHLYYNE